MANLAKLTNFTWSFFEVNLYCACIVLVLYLYCLLSPFRLVPFTPQFSPFYLVLFTSTCIVLVSYLYCNLVPFTHFTLFPLPYSH